MAAVGGAVNPLPSSQKWSPTANQGRVDKYRTGQDRGCATVHFCRCRPLLRTVDVEQCSKMLLLLTRPRTMFRDDVGSSALLDGAGRPVHRPGLEPS